MTDVLEQTIQQETSALTAPAARPADRSLPILIHPEPARTRWMWNGVLCAILLMYAFTLFAFWAPSDGGIDQNAYLVGGKQLAHSHSTGVFPASPFEYVGAMFVIPESANASNVSFYPKYPFGLPLLYAIVLRVAGSTHGVDFAFAVSPICAVIAVAGMFFLARAVAGSFAAILAMIVFATSEVMWLLADVANSHVSCVAFVVWGMFLLIRWWQTRSLWRGILAGFLLGYACTIRYTEGLLIISLLAVVIMRLRWKDWRSYLRNFWPILAWAVPVVALLMFNHFTIGDWTGYDGSNESAIGHGFTWGKFSDTWEQTLRTFHDQGLFFTLPLGIVGLFLLAVRSWRTALVMIGWLLPGAVLYTSYYWSPERGVAFARFFLTAFPAALVGLAVCIRFGMLRDADETRGHRVAMTLAAGAIVAIAAGVGTWRSLWNEEGTPGGFNGSLSNQYRSRQSLAVLGSTLRSRVPDGSVLFSEAGRGLDGATNYLQFAGNWELFATNSFDKGLLRNLRNNGPIFGDMNNPTPIQPHRRDVMREIYDSKNDSDLNEEGRRIVTDALMQHRQVFIVGNAATIDGFARRMFPAARFSSATKYFWKDVPEPRDAEGNAIPTVRRRRNGFGGPVQNRPAALDQKPIEWKLLEITLAPPKPAIVPTTKPTTTPKTTLGK